MQSVESRIRALLAQQLDTSIEKITPEASFVDDLGIESLETIQIVMALEEEFNIEIPDEDSEQMSKVRDLVEYLVHKLNNSNKK
ncbi:MAG: acyl carrier protein [Candidatus Omnitrophica bacterium]|nr:acyl carrier protein [Candidatus Omnitrophota bacterium]